MASSRSLPTSCCFFSFLRPTLHGTQETIILCNTLSLVATPPPTRCIHQYCTHLVSVFFPPPADWIHASTVSTTAVTIECSTIPFTRSTIFSDIHHFHHIPCTVTQTCKPAADHHAHSKPHHRQGALPATVIDLLLPNGIAPPMN